MKINVQTNIDQVLARLERYRREVVDKAIVFALNRCVEMARTDAARELRRAGYNIKAARIKANISIGRKASTGSLVATLRVNKKPLPLIEYDARQTAKGVSVKVSGNRKVVKGAFIATVKTGHKGVFVRGESARHKKVVKNGRAQWSALPIRQLYGPSIGGAYASDRVQAAMAKAIADNFNRRLEHEIRRLSK